MKRLSVLAAASVAVLLVGCTPQTPPVTPSPSLPTFVCTPEAGGAQAPCSEQQYQQMKAKDALYTEAERVYRLYTAELMAQIRRGGADSIPPQLQRLISGKELAASLLQRLREVQKNRLTFKGPNVQIVSASRLPTREKDGSTVTMRFCGDSSKLTVYKDGQKYGQGVISQETVYFEGSAGAITMQAIEFEDVDKC